MEIRPSTYDDAWAAAELRRRSIPELCVEDRGSHPARLAVGDRDVAETAAFGLPAFRMSKELQP